MCAYGFGATNVYALFAHVCVYEWNVYNVFMQRITFLDWMLFSSCSAVYQIRWTTDEFKPFLFCHRKIRIPHWKTNELPISKFNIHPLSCARLNKTRRKIIRIFFFFCEVIPSETTSLCKNPILKDLKFYCFIATKKKKNELKWQRKRHRIIDSVTYESLVYPILSANLLLLLLLIFFFSLVPFAQTEGKHSETTQIYFPFSIAILCIFALLVVWV